MLCPRAQNSPREIAEAFTHLNAILIVTVEFADEERLKKDWQITMLLESEAPSHRYQTDHNISNCADERSTEQSSFPTSLQKMSSANGKMEIDKSPNHKSYAYHIPSLFFVQLELITRTARATILVILCEQEGRIVRPHATENETERTESHETATTTTDVGTVATEAARTEETRTDLAKGLTGTGTGAVTKTKAGTEMTGAKGEKVAGMMGTDVARETMWTSMLILRSPQSDLNQMTEWMVPRRRHHHLEDPLLHLPGIAQAAERLTGETARVTETAGTMTGLADALAAHETNLTTIITIEGTETPDAGVIGVVHPATTKTMDVAVTEDPPHRRLRLRRLLSSEYR